MTQEIPEFSLALQHGRDYAVAVLVVSLFNRAIGMTIKETRTMYDQYGNVTRVCNNQEAAPAWRRGCMEITDSVGWGLPGDVKDGTLKPGWKHDATWNIRILGGSDVDLDFGR